LSLFERVQASFDFTTPRFTGSSARSSHQNLSATPRLSGMSTLSDETLRKILNQIQTTAVQSQRSLTVARQQIAVKDRDRRILQLTIDEISHMEGDVNLYKGVGKMFLMTPRATMEQELKNQEKELTDDINNLNKKSKYLEKQFSDAQSQLRDIFHHAPKQQ
jgi:prefoldin subunit 1